MGIFILKTPTWGTQKLQKLLSELGMLNCQHVQFLQQCAQAEQLQYSFFGVENATVAQLTTPRANYTGALAESFCGPRATPAKCIYLQWSRETGKCHYHHLQEAKGSCTEIQSLLHSAKQGSCRRLSKIHD